MKITKDEVDQKQLEMESFEKLIPGIRYGEDYPEFALAVVGSKTFAHTVQSATLLGMMSMLSIPKKPESPEEMKAAFEDMMSSSPLREVILRSMYLGYKLGKM